MKRKISKILYNKDSLDCHRKEEGKRVFFFLFFLSKVYNTRKEILGKVAKDEKRLNGRAPSTFNSVLLYQRVKKKDIRYTILANSFKKVS